MNQKTDDKADTYHTCKPRVVFQNKKYNANNERLIFSGPRRIASDSFVRINRRGKRLHTLCRFRRTFTRRKKIAPDSDTRFRSMTERLNYFCRSKCFNLMQCDIFSFKNQSKWNLELNLENQILIKNWHSATVLKSSPLIIHLQLNLHYNCKLTVASRHVHYKKRQLLLNSATLRYVKLWFSLSMFYRHIYIRARATALIFLFIALAPLRHIALLRHIHDARLPDIMCFPRVVQPRSRSRGCIL